jgi:hypothetical protein
MAVLVLLPATTPTDIIAAELEGGLWGAMKELLQ